MLVLVRAESGADFSDLLATIFPQLCHHMHQAVQWHRFGAQFDQTNALYGHFGVDQQRAKDPVWRSNVQWPHCPNDPDLLFRQTLHTPKGLAPAMAFGANLLCGHHFAGAVRWTLHDGRAGRLLARQSRVLFLSSDLRNAIGCTKRDAADLALVVLGVCLVRSQRAWGQSSE